VTVSVRKVTPGASRPSRMSERSTAATRSRVVPLPVVLLTSPPSSVRAYRRVRTG
jgi:hypothetical protein